MTYRIFVSHASADKQVAQEIVRVLNNAFHGDLIFYLAFKQLSSGDAWKQEIKDNLETCDAIMSLFTSDSISRPWLYVEWSAYWIRDKKFYILLDNDVKVSDLFQPMQDRQITSIRDESSVKSLFRALNDDSRHGTVPYEFVKEFMESISDSINAKHIQKFQDSYGLYRDASVPLPRDDDEKEKIAFFFLENKETDHLKRICAQIQDEFALGKIVTSLVQKKQIDSAVVISQNIKNSDVLGQIGLRFVDNGFSETSQFRQLGQMLVSRNQAELRKIVVHMIERGELDTGNLRFLIGEFSNMAELRKIGDYLVQNSILHQPLFELIIQTIRRKNLAELRKLALEFISTGLGKNEFVFEILDILSKGNQRELEKLATEIFYQDKVLFDKILNQNLITQSESLERLRNLSK